MGMMYIRAAISIEKLVLYGYTEIQGGICALEGGGNEV